MTQLPDPEPGHVSTGYALVRAVTCVHPPRLGAESRFIELAEGVLCLRNLARLLAFFAVATLCLGFVVEPRGRKCGFCESKSDIVKATVKKYAFEAYPAWRVQHPDIACPARLEELNEFMNNKDIKDAWGGAYAYSCDGSGILVWSRGEDGLLRTSDDIWSDR